MEAGFARGCAKVAWSASWLPLQPMLREKAFNFKPEKWPAAEYHSALRTCNTQVSTGREGLGRLDFLVWITCKPPST